MKKIYAFYFCLLFVHSCTANLPYMDTVLNTKAGILSIATINVNNHTQGDSHLIITPTGEKILIDAGYRSEAQHSLLTYLKNKKISDIDIGISTHAHKDHYEGFQLLIEQGIKINILYHTLPDKEVCNREIPWGCNFDQYIEFLNFIKKKGTKLKIPKQGEEILSSNDGLKINVLTIYNGKNGPVGTTDINDATILLMLMYRNFKYYFAADLNKKLGRYLARNSKDKDINAMVLKVPHHGTEGVAENEFFNRVDPKIAIVPSPAELWCSKRSKRIRSYFFGKKIPVFVNGFHGNIIIETDGKKIKIIPQRKVQIECNKK